MPNTVAANRAKTCAALALIAIVNNIIIWLACARPFALTAYADRPLYDLFRHSADAPQTPHWMLAVFVSLTILYLLAWRLAQRAGGRAVWAIVLGSAGVSAALCMGIFPVGAADIFDYIVHGRILLFGGNPFIHTGLNLVNDPFVLYMGWPDLVCTYGPIWAFLGGLAARLAGSGVIANVIAFKLLVGLFFCASLALIAGVLRRVAPTQALAGVLALAWNPLALYETFGNGHNDIVMLFWILAAVWLILRRRYTLTILALLAGALVKYIPLLLVPAAALIALRDLPTWRARLRFIGVTALAALALVGFAYAPLWAGPDSLTILQRDNLFTASLPTALWAALQPAWTEEAAGALVGRAALLATGLFSLWQAYCAWRDRSWQSLPRAGFWIMQFYLLFACLWFQEWYTLWPAALAALLADDALLFLATALNVTGYLKAYLFGPLWLWARPQPTQLWWELRLGPASFALAWTTLALHALQRALATLGTRAPAWDIPATANFAASPGSVGLGTVMTYMVPLTPAPATSHRKG